MPSPSLKIPVSVDLAGFKKAMSETSSLAGTAKKSILKQFSDLNAELGGPMLANLTAGYARAALGIAGKFAVVVGAVKLMGDAVDTVRDQIKAMVDVADKATARGLSPEFFQQFTAGAKGAEEKVQLFESALTHAFQSLKPILNPDWQVWDQGVQKVTAIETAMRGLRELFTTGV